MPTCSLRNSGLSEYLTRSRTFSSLKESRELRDGSQVIVHVDMDMFYAAVEMRDQPELADKPMAVGGMGMLSTSNYKVLQR